MIAQRDLLLVALIAILFLLIRSINFPYFLNFSSDQALHSTAALEIYKNRRIILIGPELTSIVSIGRHIFYGPLVYLLELLFLILGGFDPLKSSFAMVVVGSLMVFPLYFGLLNLTNRLNAIFISLIFALLPFYIDYSRFLWNPNYLLILLPGLVYLMGLFKRHHHDFVFFLIFIYLGCLIQLHYSFFFGFLLLLLFYIFQREINFKKLLLAITGSSIGLSPLIIFEFKHQFYNLQTVLLYLKIGFGHAPLLPHYFLGLSFLVLVIVFILLPINLNKYLVIGTLLLLVSLDLYHYLPTPSHAFGMIDHWNYLEEAKVFNIIKNEHLSNFNVVNLPYDTLASVQKYLLKKDGLTQNYDDYHTNKFLFVINKDDRYFENPAYEVKTFPPSTLVKSWAINSYYNLYLLQRN